MPASETSELEDLSSLLGLLRTGKIIPEKEFLFLQQVLVARQQLADRVEAEIPEEPLFDAAIEGDVNNIKTLLEQHADWNINAKSPITGGSPLHHAVLSGNTPATRELLKRGAEVDVQIVSTVPENANYPAEVHQCLDQERGRTPLMLACMARPSPLSGKDSVPIDERKQLVTLLIAHGANVDSVDDQGHSALYHAMDSGYVWALKLLGASIEQQILGLTPLQHVASNGNVAATIELLDAGANIEAVAEKQSRGRAIHFASALGHAEIVAVLLARGALQAARDNKNCTPLELAIASGCQAVVKKFYQHDRNAVDVLKALFFASGHGHNDLVSWLAALPGVDVNKPFEDDKPNAYSIALMSGHVDTANLLAKQGARILIGGEKNEKGKLAMFDLNRLAIHGKIDADSELLGTITIAGKYAQCHLTVAHVVALYGCFHLLTLLIRKYPSLILDSDNALGSDSSGMIPLLLAFELWDKNPEDFKRTQTMYEQRIDDLVADMNMPDVLLHANNGEIEKLKLSLSKAGKKPLEVRDKEGRTLLRLAVGNEHRALIDFLLQEGACNELITDSNALIRLADAHEDKTLVKYLKGIIASFNANKASGGSLLHFAASQNFVTRAGTLIKTGEKIGALNQYGQTPLHLAAENGQAGVAELLITHGASVKAPDEDNWTPLHSAARNGHTVLVELLCSHGSALFSRTNSCKTPKQLAEENGHTSAATLLEEKEKPQRTTKYSEVNLRTIFPPEKEGANQQAISKSCII